MDVVYLSILCKLVVGNMVFIYRNIYLTFLSVIFGFLVEKSHEDFKIYFRKKSEDGFLSLFLVCSLCAISFFLLY